MRPLQQLPTALFLSLLLSACAQQTLNNPETIHVCDSQGCSDRAAGSATYVPAPAGPNPDPDGRIPALETLADNDPHAAYDLALRYFRGDGVRQDSYQAIRWMRDAAERGDLQAQKALGRLYLTGLEELGPDPIEAEKWLGMSATRGDIKAKRLLAEAAAARKNEQAWFRWQSQWRPVFYGYWYSGYPYRGAWGQGGWQYH